MKRVIISTFLFFVFLTGWAQSFPVGELNDNMQRFYKGCMTLREGIASKDVITLDKAIELLDDDAQNPDRIELYSLSLGCADTINQCSMQGHMYYDADYAEFFKENMGLGALCTIKHYILIITMKYFLSSTFFKKQKHIVCCAVSAGSSRVLLEGGPGRAGPLDGKPAGGGADPVGLGPQKEKMKKFEKNEK